MVVLLKADWEMLDVRKLFGTKAKEKKSTKQPATRVMWGLIRGPVPKDKLIIRTCLIPRCVNPYHQKLGLKREMMKLQYANKKRPIGNDHPTKVLTARKVKTIVRRYFSTDISQAELARQYGIHAATVNQIVRGKNWSHVTGLTKNNYRRDWVRRQSRIRKPPIVRFRD